MKSETILVQTEGLGRIQLAACLSEADSCEIPKSFESTELPLQLFLGAAACVAILMTGYGDPS